MQQLNGVLISPIKASITADFVRMSLQTPVECRRDVIGLYTREVLQHTKHPAILHIPLQHTQNNTKRTTSQHITHKQVSHDCCYHGSRDRSSSTHNTTHNSTKEHINSSTNSLNFQQQRAVGQCLCIPTQPCPQNRVEVCHQSTRRKRGFLTLCTNNSTVLLFL